MEIVHNGIKQEVLKFTRNNLHHRSQDVSFDDIKVEDLTLSKEIKEEWLKCSIVIFVDGHKVRVFKDKYNLFNEEDEKTN